VFGIQSMKLCQTMSKLIELNKSELICKIQSINRDKHRLKTLLSRHQLLNHFYDKLYHNCIQVNGNRRRSHRKQTNSKLRSTQTQLLSQIRMISECDKSAKVCLLRHPSLDTPVHRLFKGIEGKHCSQLLSFTPMSYVLCID
jgi:hypothetical protein